jgi:hypothetical protein
MRALKGSLGHSPKVRYRESEGPRSTAAVGPTRVPFQKREASELGRMGKEWPGALLARRAPTMKLWSLDVRSKGQPWPFPLEVFGAEEGDGA